MGYICIALTIGFFQYCLINIHLYHYMFHTHNFYHPQPYLYCAVLAETWQNEMICNKLTLSTCYSDPYDFCSYTDFNISS